MERYMRCLLKTLSLKGNACLEMWPLLARQNAVGVCALTLFTAVYLSRCRSLTSLLARRSHWPRSLDLQGRQGQLEALAHKEFKVSLELRYEISL
jgi:hypothetical protein